MVVEHFILQSFHGQDCQLSLEVPQWILKTMSPPHQHLKCLHALEYFCELWVKQGMGVGCCVTVWWWGLLSHLTLSLSAGDYACNSTESAAGWALRNMTIRRRNKTPENYRFRQVSLRGSLGPSVKGPGPWVDSPSPGCSSSTCWSAEWRNPTLGGLIRAGSGCHSCPLLLIGCFTLRWQKTRPPPCHVLSPLGNPGKATALHLQLSPNHSESRTIKVASFQV